jgi:hypothetical protein
MNLKFLRWTSRETGRNFKFTALETPLLLRLNATRPWMRQQQRPNVLAPVHKLCILPTYSANPLPMALFDLPKVLLMT